MFEKIKRIHFVGIGGAGMAGIAKVLHTLGYRASGSDLKSSETTRRLSRLGIKVFLGHRSIQVKGADVVVVSTAVPAANPEIEAAKVDHIPIIPRAEMLAELMRLKYGIAVAGTHGKTTTTSLASLILAKGNIDPTVIVGGKVKHLKSNARIGEGKYLLAEADESDGSFLTLNPTIVLVTNIDNDHLDFYGELERIKEDFLKFINKIPFYGVALLCYDNKEIRSLLPQVKRKYLTYGLDPRAEITAKKIVPSARGTSFELFYQGKNLGEFKINLMGRHNLTNALGAIGIGIVLGVDIEKIKEALTEFKGVERRLQILGRIHGAVIIDDYGHHPTEIEATLEAVKNRWPKKTLKVVFQPHRYSRTKLLHQEFGRVFNLADSIIITDIYPAGEAAIPEISSELIVKAIRKKGKSVIYHPELNEDLKNLILGTLSPKDVILTLGAGDIRKVAEAVLRKTELRQEEKADWKKELPWLIKGKVKFAEPMCDHTTFAVGGPAEAWIEPRDIEDLKNLMVFVKKHKLNYLVVGKGSNIIVKDRGVRGLVINLSRYFRKIRFIPFEIAGHSAEQDERIVYSVERTGKDDLSAKRYPLTAKIAVQAGLDLSDLLWQLEKNGLTGLEFLKGIPGTVGGVIWMNAGLADKNIGEFVSHLKIINEKGEIKEFNSDQLQFAYRKAILPEAGVIYEVTLKLAGGSKKTVKQVGKAYLQRKMESQPLSFASAGCIFKNPAGKPASLLIDELNLKGCRHGGAEISSQHANFIIKKGETKAADILSLIQIVEREAREKQGISLEKEIVVVGED